MTQYNSDTLSKILRTMKGMVEDYNIACDGHSEAEGLGNDLRHDLELKEYSYHQRARLATELQAALRERRRWKDYAELLESFARWYQDNQQFIKSLERVLGDMRFTEERHQKRSYMYRVMKKDD